MPPAKNRREGPATRRLTHVGTVTGDTIELALDLHQSDSLSYWDALIVASAHIAGCAVLLTEDIGHGQVLAGVRLVNPLA